MIDIEVHAAEHGEGEPVIALHGSGVDHREIEACCDPAFQARGGLRRIYPDLPGMGRTLAPETLRGADDVLAVMIDFVADRAAGAPVRLLGHSAGAYYAQGLAARRPDLVAGLALICPLLPGPTDVPEHRPVVAGPSLGDDEFRGYFVQQTPAMLDRYERYVAPGAALADRTAAERIGASWELRDADAARYPGATLVVAGRRDSIVGFGAAVGYAATVPDATLAVLDRAGHALPHEQPALLTALLHDWLDRSAT